MAIGAAKPEEWPSAKVGARTGTLGRVAAYTPPHRNSAKSHDSKHQNHCLNLVSRIFNAHSSL